jgi:hypothetical protein
MTIEESLNYLLKQLETITTVAVQSVRSNIFKVTVGNFPKTQDVKGTVVVGNQKNVENKLEEITKAVRGIPSVTIPKSFEVSNFPKSEKIVIPEFPAEMTVKNPQKTVEVTNLETVTKELQKLGKQIEKMDVAPKVTVKAPQVKVEAAKAPIVNIPESEKLFSNDPKKYVPVRLTDGEEFYEAVNSVVRGLNWARRMTFDENGRMLVTTSTENTLKVVNYADATYKYICLAVPGTASSDAKWKVVRETIATEDIDFADAGSFNNQATDLSTVQLLSYS